MALGILLGALNVLIIATGLAAIDGDPSTILLVAMYGIVPGVVLGALLGWVAGVMNPLPIWVRRFVIAFPAVLLVWVLASFFLLQEFILVSCIPTAVAVLVLERATRLVLPPPLPPATARG